MKKPPLVSAEAKMMGTLIRVTLAQEDSVRSREGLWAAMRVFEGVERSMSEWRTDSEVSEISRQAGIAPVKVSDDLFRILEISLRMARETEGAFDVTWAALRGLWKFKGEPRIPDQDEIQKALKQVDWKALVLDPQRQSAFLDRSGMKLGLGGIAKGYALRLAAEELRRREIQDFLLYAGGQFYAGGRKGDRAWSIGIQDPRKERGAYFATLPIQNASVSTSGDYESCFIQNGVRYHHILDLRTGFPARGVRSATVLDRDAVSAEAYSTACFVLGPEKGLELANRLGFELLLVDDLGVNHMTERMREVLRIVAR